MTIRSLTFSPDSQILLTASDDGHLKMYDVQHANLAGTLSGHSSSVASVAFSPDNTHFVSAYVFLISLFSFLVFSFLIPRMSEMDG